MQKRHRRQRRRQAEEALRSRKPEVVHRDNQQQEKLEENLPLLDNIPLFLVMAFRQQCMFTYLEPVAADKADIPKIISKVLEQELKEELAPLVVAERRFTQALKFRVRLPLV
jgi:hypothetical protein